jgi:hypothetical protein
MHILIVTECCNTSLKDAGFDTFEALQDGTAAVVASGSLDELEAMVEGWPHRMLHPVPWPSFRAYTVQEGLTVMNPVIVRVGRF